MANLDEVSKKSNPRWKPFDGFHSFLNSELHSDIILQVPCGSEMGGAQFYAHKAILAARSPFFKDFFTHFEGEVYPIMGVSGSSLYSVLEYMYTDRIRQLPLEMDKAYEIITLARQFELHGLECRLMPPAKKGTTGMKMNAIASSVNSQPNVDSIRTLWEDIQQLFIDTIKGKSDVFTDITFIVEGKQYRAHKVIVAAGSSYFHSLLKWNWKESTQDVIVLHDISIECFEIVYKFLYSNYLEIEGLNEAVDLYKLSQFFQVDSMGIQCEEFIVDTNVETETVCVLWNYSKELQADNLFESCRHFFIANFMQCTETSGFLELDKDLLRCALNAGEVDEDHNMIFEAIKKWGQVNQEKYKVSFHALISELLPPHTLFNRRMRYSLLALDPDPLIQLLGFGATRY